MNRRRNSEDEDPELRRLLSGLPDPGPVPEDLVARISRSLAEEDRPQLGTPRRFDTAITPRPHRRLVASLTAVTLTVAATATALALHLDDEAVTHEARRAWAALNPNDPDTLRSGSVPAVVGASRDLPVGAGAPTTAPADALAGLTILTSGTDYERARFTTQLADLSEAESIDAPGDGPAVDVPSRHGLSRCLRAARLDPQYGLLDVATFEGRPALLVLADPVQTPGSEQVPEHQVAVVLPRSCVEGSTTPLAGPVPVP